MVKNLPTSAGDAGSVPGSERFPAGGNGSPLQYSCLESSMDGGAWWAAVHGITKSRTRLSDRTELKWALESITTNKASGSDVIPVELFQICKDDAVKVLH